MQSVPFDGTAPDLDAEVQRQIDARLLDAGLADKLDLDRVRPFFESAVWRRIRHARAVLREEPFITALPAAQITPEAGECEACLLYTSVLRPHGGKLLQHLGRVGQSTAEMVQLQHGVAGGIVGAAPVSYTHLVMMLTQPGRV